MSARKPRTKFSYTFRCPRHGLFSYAPEQGEEVVCDQRIKREVGKKTVFEPCPETVKPLLLKESVR